MSEASLYVQNTKKNVHESAVYAVPIFLYVSNQCVELFVDETTKTRIVSRSRDK